jgi:Tol biopolymer transport system component
MRDAACTLDERYGPSGFPQITLFVTRDLRRGFNDGSGLMGLSIRYFRAGDYGFGIIAHEIAHNWWGSTVAEKWLSPGTGGEWLVEGFAEFSSLIAIEAKYGAAGLTRRLASEFFDPERQAAVADMSVLDNVLAEATARDTIYRKGAYVAIMLRAMLGEEAYFSTLRQFLERFRYQQATEADLQQMLQQLNGEDLARYFSDWVRSDRLADLSLDEAGPGAITVSNLGAATIAGPIDLWAFKKDGGEPIRTTVKVGDTVTLAADGDSWVLDPLLAWADMERENNRYPRRHDPVYAAAAPGGIVALTRGGTLPWVRTTVSATASGSTKQTWDFERGMAEPPAWSADAARLIVSTSEAAEPLPAIVTLATDGGRRLLGHGSAPAAAPDGAIYAGKHDRIVRLGSDGRETEVVQRRGEVLDMPLPSPDGTRLVYTAARGNHVELRAVRPDGRGDHVLLSWDRDWMLYRWSTEGTRLYAVAGGDWDWQIWEIPLGAGAVQVLAAGAAAIGDLALSPDGRQLAFTAAPSLDYPINRRQLYVLDPANRAVRNVDVPGADLSQVTWLDGEVVLVVATTVDPGHPWTLPAERSLKRVSVADGGIEDAP